VTPRGAARRHASRGTGAVLAFALAAWLGCSTSDPGGASDPTADAGGTPTDGGAPVDAGGATGDASASDAADASADAEPVVPPSPECNTYCDTVLNHCGPTIPQFGSRTACLNACALYAPGTPDDWSSYANTRSCRQYHANSSDGDGKYHCFHGGPFGYGSCGSSCDAVCMFAMTWCAKSAAGAPFPSHAVCMSECLAWPWAPQGPDGLAVYRADSPTSGDTLECREVMLVKSLESAAARDTYCPLAVTNSPTCK